MRSQSDDIPAIGPSGNVDPVWSKDLSIVIPAFNEEDGIRLVLRGLRDALPAAEIIVVDDASTDKTIERAETIEAVTVIRHHFNRGYGASLKTGMRRARGNYIAWFDADNEHKVKDLIDLADKLTTRRCAAVIGERASQAPSFVRFVGKAVIRLLARSLGGPRIKDINCGLRVFHRDAITRYVPMLPEKFSASMTSTMILMQRGYPIEFHPVTLNSRIGASKVRLKDGLTALFSVVRIVMLVAPLRILFTSGFSAVLFGGVYGLLRLIKFGDSFPTSAFVVITVGMFLCVLGLIADQISQFRFGMVERLGVPGREEANRGSGKQADQN